MNHCNQYIKEVRVVIETMVLGFAAALIFSSSGKRYHLGISDTLMA